MVEGIATRLIFLWSNVIHQEKFYQEKFKNDMAE